MLITLGIIGVVAALTLPVLTKKYQEIVLKNQFKKSYSMLSQAIVKAQSEFGSMPYCYKRTYNLVPQVCSHYNSLGVCTSSTQLDGSPVPKNQTGEIDDCPQFWPLVRKQIKIIKTCDKNSLQKGCIPQYKGRDEIAQESQSAKPGDDDYMDDYGKQMIANCSMWTKSQLDNTTASYVLADGSIIISAYNGDKGSSFAYDVNGKKGPNKWGYDVFVFAIVNNAKRGQSSITQLTAGAGHCMSAESGGKLTADMIKLLYK
ncbi:TPA: hypothetical protein IAC10_00255 [Candidatus Scatousia excrementigallinarum]|uniref:Prepilin-type cleavage/methylation domain-containing protein n=1 Tax=Candidatus Scatousia excrementigallinarum TaxID=2840935 RepID=A0A9D1EWN7_9BACT|nr:hypothetical protein [Candidatus Scatousia excrementigallinarum]